jgi:hypothetical protein
MITWTIPLTEYTNDSDKGIVTCHWRVTAEDGEYTASAYGTCGFTPDPSAPDFVPYDNLTEADVLQWVFDSMGAEQVISIQDALTAQIEDQKAPQTVAGLPW